jgi:hypothetical protein
MSMPAPIGGFGGLPGTIELPLRNGAEQAMNMANTQAAQMMTGSGASLSGKSKLKLILDCPRRP